MGNSAKSNSNNSSKILIPFPTVIKYVYSNLTDGSQKVSTKVYTTFDQAIYMVICRY